MKVEVDLTTVPDRLETVVVSYDTVNPERGVCLELKTTRLTGPIYVYVTPEGFINAATAIGVALGTVEKPDEVGQ